MAEEKRSPVWYIARELSNINNELIQPGQRVQYDGLPSDNLEPTNDEGRARAEEFKRTDRERQQRQIEDTKDSAVGDPEKFAAAFAREMAAQKKESEDRLAAVLEDARRDRETIKQQNEQIAAILKNATGTSPATSPADGQVKASETSAPVTKTYDDGSKVTGQEPLPEDSPLEEKPAEEKQGKAGKHKA